MWFAIFESVSGLLVSVGTVIADDVTLSGRGLEKRSLLAEPNLTTHIWDTVTRDFILRSASTLTADELERVRILGLANPNQADVAKAVQLLLKGVTL